MNWKRGFLRLWIVLAVVWVAASLLSLKPWREIGYLLAESPDAVSQPAPNQKAREWKPEDGLKPIEGEPDSLLPGSQSVEPKSGPWEKYGVEKPKGKAGTGWRDDSLVEGGNGEKWRQSALAVETPVPQTLVERMSQEAQMAQKQAAPGELVHIAAVAFAPPAGLFLFGWLVAWVAGGFRRKG